MISRSRFGITTAVMLLFIGALARWPSPTVGAQERAGVSPWEYRAVVFLAHESVDEHTKQLNDLASAGWEYVGVLVSPFSNGNVAPKSTVVFRRLNRHENSPLRGSLPRDAPDDDSREPGEREADDHSAKVAVSLKDMHAASRQLLELRTREYQAGKSPFAALWTARRQFLEVELKLAQTAQDRLKVLSQQLLSAKEMEKLVEAGFRAGSVSQGDLLQAQLARMQIELSILEQAE